MRQIKVEQPASIKYGMTYDCILSVIFDVHYNSPLHHRIIIYEVIRLMSYGDPNEFKSQEYLTRNREFLLRTCEIYEEFLSKYPDYEYFDYLYDATLELRGKIGDFI